jgi:hypothetical protein
MKDFKFDEVDPKDALLKKEREIKEVRVKVSKIGMVINFILLVIAGFIAAEQFLLFSYFRYISFSVSYPEMIEAAIKVKAEEKKIIEAKIAEVKKESIQRMLAPLVVTNTK